MFHEPIYKHKVLQIQIWLIISILAKQASTILVSLTPWSFPLKCFKNKGFQHIEEQTAAHRLLFRQNLIYLSFLPKTEKCT